MKDKLSFTQLEAGGVTYYKVENINHPDIIGHIYYNAEIDEWYFEIGKGMGWQYTFMELKQIVTFMETL